MNFNVYEKVSNDLISYIFSYLSNYDAFKLRLLSIEYKKLAYSSWFFNYIKYRNHPVVFNNIDNICYICNTKTIIIFPETPIMHCKHGLNHQFLEPKRT